MTLEPRVYSGSYELREPVPDTAFGVPETINAELNHKDIVYGLIDRVGEKSAMEFKNLTLYKDNDKTYEVLVRDRNLNPINLQGATCVMTLKVNEDDVIPVIQKSTANPSEGQIGNAGTGQVFFYIVPADTSSLESRQYLFDVRVTVSNGKTYTVSNGVIYIKDTVNP